MTFFEPLFVIFQQ